MTPDESLRIALPKGRMQDGVLRLAPGLPPFSGGVGAADGAEGSERKVRLVGGARTSSKSVFTVS